LPILGATVLKETAIHDIAGQLLDELRRQLSQLSGSHRERGGTAQARGNPGLVDAGLVSGSDLD